VWLTAPQLPERVATHFGASGEANGWMTRDGHVRFLLLMGFAVPAFLVGVFALVRRLGGRGLNIPHKDYWLAPEREEETFAFIQRQGFWMAALFIGFFAAIQRSIVVANSHSPATLTAKDAAWSLGPFVVAMFIWIACFIGRFFRKPA
jgi:uncharacterized membrane protein